MTLDFTELVQQKQKYHAKVLKQSAVDVNLQRILDVNELMTRDIWLSIPPICWSAMSPILLFDIPPFEIEPLMLYYDIEIPHITFQIPRTLLEQIVSLPSDIALTLLPSDIIDKLMDILAPGMKLTDIIDIIKTLYPPALILTLPPIVTIDLPNFRALYFGIYLIITPINLLNKYPWLASLEAFVYANIKQPYADQILSSIRLKGIYDETPYERSYYDPTVWRSFITSTYTKIFLHYRTPSSWRMLYKELSEAGEMNLDMLKEMYNRFQLVAEAYRQHFILGYNLLGFSTLSPRIDGKLVTRITDYDGNELEVRHDNLDQLQYGFILDISHLDIAYLMPDETIYKNPPVELKESLATIRVEPGAPPAAYLVADKAYSMKRKSVYIPWLLANYTTAEEMTDYHKAARVSQWHELQAVYRMLDNMVEGALERYKVDVFKKRMYKNAVRQLIAWRVKRHKWGMAAWRSMSDEEYREWWIQHWESQGLSRVILNELYDVVSACLNQLQQRVSFLGRLVKRRRPQLAYLLKYSASSTT